MGHEDDIKDLWKGIADVRERLNESAKTLASIKTLLEERCAVRGLVLCNLEERVKDLERRVWWASGGAAALAAIVSWVISMWGKGQQ